MNNLNIDIKGKKTKKLVNINLFISFIVALLGLLLLSFHYTYYISIYLYKSSLIIFRTGLLIGVFSIICGIFFEKYLNCE